MYGALCEASIRQHVYLQVLNAYGKVFPTPPPSRRPIRVKQARLAAEKAAQQAAQQAGEEEVDGEGTAKQETDKAGRHKLGKLALPWCFWQFCLERCCKASASYPPVVTLSDAFGGTHATGASVSGHRAVCDW